MNEKLKAFLKGIMSDMVVFALSVSYTLTAFVTIQATGKSVWQILGEGVVAFLMGFFLNRALERQGISEGDGAESVRLAAEKHAAMVDCVVPYVDRLEEWCDMQNSRALKRMRERLLAESSLCYSDFFDDDGMAYELVPDGEKLKNRYLRKGELLRLRAYYRALGVKLTRLTAATLMSEGGREGDPFYLGRSKAEYQKETARRDALTKTVLAVLFGYYGVTLISDFSIAALIWKLFQVVTFLVIGSVKKSMAYTYVTEEYRGRLIKKTMHLQAFSNYLGLNLKEDGKNGVK